MDSLGEASSEASPLFYGLLEYWNCWSGEPRVVKEGLLCSRIGHRCPCTLAAE